MGTVFFVPVAVVILACRSVYVLAALWAVVDARPALALTLGIAYRLAGPEANV